MKRKKTKTYTKRDIEKAIMQIEEELEDMSREMCLELTYTTHPVFVYECFKKMKMIQRFYQSIKNAFPGIIQEELKEENEEFFGVTRSFEGSK